MKPTPGIDSVSKLITHNLIWSDKVISSRRAARSAAAITLPLAVPLMFSPRPTSCQTPLSFKSKLKTFILLPNSLLVVMTNGDGGGTLNVSHNDLRHCLFFFCTLFPLLHLHSLSILIMFSRAGPVISPFVLIVPPIVFREMRYVFI